MEESAKPETVHQKEEHFIDKMLKVAAFPFAAAAGYWRTQHVVNYGAYNIVKHLKGFQKILVETDKKGEENIKNMLDGKIDLAAFQAETAKIKEGYDDVVNAHMTKLGLRKFIPEWKYVSKDARQRAFMEGVAAAGITIGAMLTIADNRWLSKRFSKDKNDNERCQ